MSTDASPYYPQRWATRKTTFFQPADEGGYFPNRVRADQVICLGCHGTTFAVGRASYYTAIRCMTCGWEECIHDG
jgi:ribosomal protein S27E